MTADNLSIAGDNSAYRLNPGQKILNRYTLVRVLGQGGMGVVWLARDEALDLDVALKFVPSLVVNDRGILSDLKRETRRNLALTHPNIVRTYDFVQGDSLAGISMEYVDGDTLRNRRLDQPAGVFEPEELGEWTLQLSEALHYAHQTAAIVHRDLKPANLLINGRKHLKVADFGIARSLGESVTQLTGRNSSAGTLLYMSPQQLEGDPAHPLDDIYAVGATLYELCTSRPPFYSGDLSRQIVLKVSPTMAERRAELGIPAGKLPQNWESTIAACLAKERAQRPQSAREIAVRLGLREAASARTGPKPLLAVQKVAVKPIAPVLPLPVVAPSRLDWKPRSLEALKRTGRTALAGAAVGLDHAKRHGRTAWEASAFRWEMMSRNGRIAVVAAAVVLVAALAAFWPRGTHNDGRIGIKQADAGQQPATAGKASNSSTGTRAGGPASIAAGARGGINLDTEPAGGLVQVDDAPMVKAPVSLKNLAAGSHSISVRMDGYDDYETKVDLKANQTADLGKVTLVPQGGSLTVTTNPPGADIVVRSPVSDTKEVHYTSPWNSGRLPVGEYDITATRPGWAPTTQKVSLAKDQAVPVVFNLMGGSVQIDSVPPNATVLVGGKAVGVTPYTMQDVPPGPIKYSLVLEGFGQTDVEGNIEAGQTTSLEGKMVAAAAADDSKDDAKTSKTASARSSHPTGHGDDDDNDHERHTTRSRRKPSGGDGNDFLSKLKKLPLPFWHH